MVRNHFIPKISRCPYGCGNLITPDEWDPQQKRCKYCPSYRSNRVSVTNHTMSFTSQEEYQRVKDLQALETAGNITHLRFHTSYDLVVHGVAVGRYVDEANYDNLDGIHIVEDIKSPETRKTWEHKRCKKLMKDLYGIDIVEL